MKTNLRSILSAALFAVVCTMLPVGCEDSRAAILHCVAEMNEVTARFQQFTEEAAKLSDRMDKLVDDVNARLPEVDDVYGKATGGKYAWPDMAPPPRIEEPSPEKFAAPQPASPQPATAAGHPLDAIIELRVVEPIRELQIQARDCYWLCGKVSEVVSFAPVPPESPLESYEAAVAERKRVYAERQQRLQEARDCYAQANRAAQAMIQGIASVKNQAKKFIDQREREKREAEDAEAQH